ncbi:MAG TPA: aldehyde ferredoxin oxidoreductase family protein [Dehalococcoidales bacterium]|nr:aldehyde ferredoxin oxidoreductase family protein [Dehalococcoidales bacterium]
MGTQAGGYNFKLLRVNLNVGNTSTETVDENFCRQYIGGAGFVTYYLLKELPPKIEPLSPENKIVIALGPLTGALLPGSDRFCIGCKSPMTDGLAKSESGGFWSVELKRAGFDIIIIEGKAKTPVYLWIHDGQVEIRGARNLWGKNTKETQEIIRTDLQDKLVRVAMIGPGGENLVRYACVMVGCHDAAGRGGVGAVMGSKNLKAIAVRGHNAPEILDPEAIKGIRQWLFSNMELVRGLHDWGTTGSIVAYQSVGNLPVRNYSAGLFPGDKIDSAAIKSTIGMTMEGCFACPIRCKKVVKMEEPYPIDPEYGAPEYESLAAFGPNCGIDHLKAIIKANELCGAYGVDTISAGNTIAFAMECFEKGLITLHDTGGINLQFGNHEAMLEMIELITRKRGFGSLLSEGIVRAAKKIGNGAEKFAIHGKGLEPGEHDPRVKPLNGLGYMIAFNGADHCMGVHDNALSGPVYSKDLSLVGMSGSYPVMEISPRKTAIFRVLHNKRILQDILLLCFFLPYSLEQYANAVRGVTGWDTTIYEQQRVADRIATVGRMFIVREGFNAKDDILSERFYQPKTDGVLSNCFLSRDELDKAKRYYYQLMSWDIETGIPLPQRLEELGIEA